MTNEIQTLPSAAASGRSVAARSLPCPGSARALVLSQSWVPFPSAPQDRSSARQSALLAAEAFSLLSSQLATRRGSAKPPTP